MAKNQRIPAKLGPFVFAYPHLTSPDSTGQYADNKYKVDGIGDPKGPAMKATKAAVESAVKELGVPKGAMLPLKQEMAKDASGNKQPTGNHLFRSKSQFAPAIVDASGKPIPPKKLAKMKIGAGSEGLLEGYFSDYVAAGKPGVSFTLTGVQLIKLVAVGGGSATFGAYEGGGFTVDDDDDSDVADDVQPGADDSPEDDGGLDI